jgi:alpha-L-rhamnosidase
MKAEADLHFLQGINQLVGHGWPYSPEAADEPGWRMYAAGAFNTHNPWSFAMPDVAGYLQRVSFALRQGKPANDVALLLPNDDAWATFKANRKQLRAVTSSAGFDESGLNVSIDESMVKLLGKTVIGAILDAGFNVDFVDADAIEKKELSYPVLILPGVDRLPLATYRKIEEYAHRGGIVIATRRLPSTAPGMVHAEVDTAGIKAISQRLFEERSHLGHYVADDRDVGSCIGSYLKPDVVLSPESREVGFIHRKLSGGDLYFLANTSNQTHDVTAHFRHKAKHAEWWDPFTGDVLALRDPAHVELDLEPYGSRLIMFSDSDAGESTASAALKPSATFRRPSLDLSQDWNLSFDGLSQPTHLAHLQSWSEDKETRFYSGVVTYQKYISLSAEDLAPATPVILDFGVGTAVPIPTSLPGQNMRAYFEGPVRDAAEVYVNGERAGVVWHPPYIVDITRFVKPGRNELRIAVGNTAINAIAGRALPDYRLLNNRYGERFVPQGMENLKPLPSGILGHPQIVFGSVPGKHGEPPRR